MSMEDILKVLVNSRQQGSPSQQNADPMADLIGGLLRGQPQSNSQQGGTDLGDMADLVGSLLGGNQPQGQSQNTNQQAGGLGGMMELLETVMGGQSQSSANPIMGLLRPFVAPLAKKANIPPEIAMVVVSFIAHKLLAHHPTSNRDLNTFDLDDMLRQMGSGKIDLNTLQNSGMVQELSRKTGLDEATAARSLHTGVFHVWKQCSRSRRYTEDSLFSKAKSSCRKVIKAQLEQKAASSAVDFVLQA